MQSGDSLTRRTVAAAHITLLATLLLTCLAPGARGQSGTRTRDPLGTGLRTGLKDAALRSPELPSNQAVASWGFEGTLDRASYRLAPGDLLAVSVWGSTDLTFDLRVTADGALIVPSVGAFSVQGMTVMDAEALLAKRCAQSYPQSDISLHLVQPAMMRIPVTGLVGLPGTISLPGGARLADLLELAGGILDGADTRAIEVISPDTAPLTYDYLAWLADGSREGNPPLHSGDRVQVAPAEVLCRVRGARPADESNGVPGGPLDRPFSVDTRLVALRGGDTLDFVLRSVGGRQASSCEPGVWVDRADSDSDTRRWVPLTEAADFRVSSGDVIEIPFCQEWIAVGGSVNRPGLYPYLSGQTVGDYVFAAGGPTLTGRDDEWELWDPATGRKWDVSPEDSVSAGLHVWVPERRSHRISQLLTPIGTAVALAVSIYALTR